MAWSRFFLAAALLLAAGCALPQAQPDLTRYYVLTAAVPPPAAASEGAHCRVALRPVQVPSFLRDKAMQLRVAGNEVTYADESRWAESLEAGLGRVLRENLEGRGAIAHVVTSATEAHDYDIAVRVLRCEGDRVTGVARFAAVVEIFSTAPGEPRRTRDTFTMEVPAWDRQSYGQLAQKLSEAVDGLSDRIAALVATADKP